MTQTVREAVLAEREACALIVELVLQVKAKPDATSKALVDVLHDANGRLRPSAHCGTMWPSQYGTPCLRSAKRARRWQISTRPLNRRWRTRVEIRRTN